jgi:hypothetical protein
MIPEHEKKYIKSTGAANFFFLAISRSLASCLITMISFTTALVALTAAVGVIAAPVDGPTDVKIKRSSPNSSGTNNGFFYQFCE